MNVRPKPILYFLVGAIASFLVYNLFLKTPTIALPPTINSTGEPQTNMPNATSDKSAVCLNKCAAMNVPTAICMTVFAQFPDVSCEQLDIETQAYGFEALFSIGDQPIEMEFDKSGNFIETEYENYPESKVPAAVLSAFRRDFLGKQVKEYEKEVYLNGSVAYEIEILGSKDVDITYDENGVRMKNSNED